MSANVRHAAHNKATHPLEGIAWLYGNDHLKGAGSTTERARIRTCSLGETFGRDIPTTGYRIAVLHVVWFCTCPLSLPGADVVVNGGPPHSDGVHEGEKKSGFRVRLGGLLESFRMMWVEPVDPVGNFD